MSEYYKFLTRAGDARGRGQGGNGSSTFLRSKKRETKKKIERVSWQKLLKGSHQDQNVSIPVLVILKRLEFKKFSFLPVMVAENTFQCPRTSPL